MLKKNLFLALNVDKKRHSVEKQPGQEAER